MPTTIPSVALGQMTEADRNRLLDAAFVDDPVARASFLAVIEARLRVFESRYEISSTELGHALRAGDLRDTADVSQWLFWTEVWSRCARQARSEPTQ